MLGKLLDGQIMEVIDDEYIEEAARFAADHEQERISRKNKRKKKAVISAAATGLVFAAFLLVIVFYHPNNAFQSPIKESDFAGRDRTDIISEEITAESQKMEELLTSDNDKIIINHFRETPYEEELGKFGDVFAGRLDMNNITAFSQKGMLNYFGLREDTEAILAGIIESVVGESVSACGDSLFFSGYGIYQEGDCVYDRNTLAFRTSGMTDALKTCKKAGITFSKRTNIPYPGAKRLSDEFSYDLWQIKEGCNISIVGGTDCIIGQTEHDLQNGPSNDEGTANEAQYYIFAKINEIDMIIKTESFTEDQMIALIKKIFVQNWGA